MLRKTENIAAPTVPREAFPDDYGDTNGTPIDPFPDQGEIRDGEIRDQVAETPPAPNLVAHPRHYTGGRFETIEVIEDWGLGFHLGNAVKYLSRAEKKGNRREDLRKAAWYVLRELWRTSEQPALLERAMAILGEEV